MNNADRWIKVQAAYDKRHVDPNKNYGIHGVTMTFYLRKSKGVMNFTLYTNWELKTVREEVSTKQDNIVVRKDYPFEYWRSPMPADVGFHSSKRQYEHQTEMDCDLLEQGKCFYDGSTLAAEDAFECLIEGGEEGLWTYLEDRYKSWSENE